MSTAPTRGVRVRIADQSDATAIATLADQLGYPANTGDIARRMENLAVSSQHIVFVAEAPPQVVIGWAHVSVDHLLESETRAELNGLVVDEARRSRGAGAMLLEAVERWARERGCKTLNLRSNVLRTRAHRFYEKMGYENYKTQKAFRKVL